MGQPFMVSLRLSRPLWLDRPGVDRVRRYAPLRHDIDADVVVIGGGITGAAVAYAFSNAGVRVALVEADRIGRGSTAASTALLMQEPDVDFGELSKRYGDTRSRRIWHLSRDATHDAVRTIRQLGIRCDLRQRDSVYYALTDASGSRLRVEHRRRERADVGGAWLDRAQLRRVTGIDGVAGIRTSGNAQLDPYRCCVGLMSAAAACGARIFERSPVRAIDTGKHDVSIRTTHGSIRADRVIVATGYATPYFERLSARFTMLQTYVVATRPLTASERRAIGLGPVMIWETGWPYHYARWTPDHRLMLGGGDRPQQSPRDRRREFRKGALSVVDYFVRLYPSLANIVFDYAWEGLFAMTPDGLPYIGPHRHHPRHLFALGYGGNGMTFGFLAAKLLLEWYRGDRSPDHELFSFSRM